MKKASNPPPHPFVEQFLFVLVLLLVPIWHANLFVLPG
jgi:hypothetical protein